MSKPISNPQKAYALCVVAILLWGSVSTVGKLYLQHVSLIEFLFYMCGFASATLFLSLLFQDKLNLLSSFKAKDYLKIIPTGIVGILIYNILYFKALTLTSAAEVSIIASTWPLILVIFSGLFYKVKITLTNWMTLLIGFFGVLIAVGTISITPSNTEALVGDVIILLSSAIFALFFILSNKMNYNNYLFMFYSYLFSFTAAGVYLLFTTGIKFPEENLFYTALYIGTLPSAIGFSFFSEALRVGNVSKIANFANLTPFASLTFISFFLSQKPTWYQICGLLVLVGAILFEKFIGKNKIDTAKDISK